MEAPGGQPPRLEIGSEFAGHRIVGVIGQGGMGVVYRATKLALDRDRALKVIAPALSAEPRFRERFKREARMAAAIEHPNVIPVHDAGEEDGLLYLAMRLVEGTDLHRAGAGRPLPPERAARIVAAVAAALDAAHAAGLVHRDVKPANVLIEPRTGGEHVYLTDFGITRALSGGDTVTGTGELVGSVEFIAPEQAAGEPVDARTDVYSLGTLAYFALTGDAPFPRETQLAALFAHANAPRPRPTERNPDLPAAIDAVIAKAMARSPDERYGSARAMAADLARALDAPVAGVPADPEPAEAAPTRRLPRQRRPLRALLPVALLAAAAAAVAVVVVATTGGDDPAPRGPTEGDRAGAPTPDPRELATIDVGPAPNALTVGELKVWVAEPRANRVEGIELRTDELTGPHPSVRDATAVAVGHDSIWVASSADDAVYRVDPRDPTEPIRIPVGADPSDVAVDRDWVWVANEDSNDVSRIDPRTNALSATEPVGAGPRSVATGGGSVWVANIDAGSVSEIDPRSGNRVGDDIETPGSRPNDLAVGEGAVWVIDNVAGTVTPIDPRAADAGEPIEVGAKPRGVKVGFGYVWVANGGDGTVVAVDAETVEVATTVPVGEDPADVAIGGGSVWTANQGASTVTRLDPGVD